MSKQKQSGFAVVELLLVLILLAIVGFTGYYVWHSRNTTEKALNVANDTAQTASPKKTVAAQKYLTITEWGVKIPLTINISDAYYVQQNGATYLSLNSYKGTNCAADATSLGAVERFTATDKDDSGSTLLADFPSAVKIGNYYYQYQHPQAACDGQKSNTTADFDQTAANKASDLMTDFKTAADKIVVAQ